MFAHHVFVTDDGKVSLNRAQKRTAGRHLSASMCQRITRQVLQQSRRNDPAVHGKEKVYGSIP